MSRGSTDKALEAIVEVLEADVLACRSKAGLTKAQIIERAGRLAQSRYTRELIPEVVAGMVEFWEVDHSHGPPELDCADRQSPDGESRYLLRRDDWPDADQARSAALSGLWCEHPHHQDRDEFEDCPEECEHSHESIDEWIDCPQSLYREWETERLALADGQ
ncbi:MAG: hypothetical protein DCC49_01190 [Acidobacteria bacterium]|nr:MAG: hypothetical protein DCC49_01190 [Acidobacteriota bacterium]